MEPKPLTEKSWPAAKTLLTRGFLLVSFLLAVAGVMVVIAVWTGNSTLAGYARFPFWLMIGLVGILLNYLPIAKSKPKLIPLIGIVVTAGTAIWFCFNNYFELNGWKEIFGRLRLDLALIIASYCATHISLLMLTYRANSRNVLLFVTCVANLLSCVSYLAILAGFAKGDFFGLALTIAGCLFFIKFGLTIATVVFSLSQGQQSTE